MNLGDPSSLLIKSNKVKLLSPLRQIIDVKFLYSNTLVWIILVRLPYMINFGFLKSLHVVPMIWPDSNDIRIELLWQKIWWMKGNVFSTWIWYFAKSSFMSMSFSGLLSAMSHSISLQSKPPEISSGELDFSGYMKSTELQMFVWFWSMRPVSSKVKGL